MAIVSNAKTATEMRAEVVHALQVAHAEAESAIRRGAGQKDLIWRRGYASALKNQIDFWQHVWVDGGQALFCPKKED
jgi:hypothetical protein